MRRIFIVFFLFIFSIPLFCQEKGKAYSISNDFEMDGSGKLSLNKVVEYRRISDDSSWGFIDSIGNIVIPLEKYKFLNPVDHEGMILAHQGEKKGFIDINENILVPFIYEDIGVFSPCVGLAPAVKDEKLGFIGRKGETVIPFEYDPHIGYFYEPGIAMVAKNGKYGVISAENKIIIPFDYDRMNYPQNGDLLFVWKADKWACFSTAGVQLSGFSDYEIALGITSYFLPEDGKNLPILVKTRENGTSQSTSGSNSVNIKTTSSAEIKYAYLNKNHKEVVPFGVYDYAEEFRLGRKAIVANQKKYGIINEYGKLVLPLEYDLVVQPSNYSKYADIFVATKENKVTIFDKELNIISDAEIVSYMNDNGTLFVTDHENKKGAIDYHGKQTIPFLYDTLYCPMPIFGVKGYIAKKDSCYGVVTKDNEIVQPFDYESIYAVRGNMVYVDQNKRVGIYGEEGKVVIPFDYSAIYDTHYNHSCHETMFPDIAHIYIVEKDGKIGTIDDKNNIIIPIVYDGLSGWVEYGPEGHFVKKHGKYGILSPKGEIIIPIEYDYVGLPKKDITVVRKNGKYGVLSCENKEILPCIYDNVILDIPRFLKEVSDGFWSRMEDDISRSKIVVLQQGTWNYYSLDGKLLQSNVPLKEINEHYDYILERDEPSNEHPDFHMKRKGGVQR